MSETLAEILVANLMQNAIRHNVEDGFIKVEVKEKEFSISNSGISPKVPMESLFKRFKRDSEVEESLGLGLSIVKRICEQSGLEISYTYENGNHEIIISIPR